MFFALCLLIQSMNMYKIPVVTQHALIQAPKTQQTTLQMSTLSLLGSDGQPAFLELVSLPHGVGKLLVDSHEGINALRWLFNDQVILSLSQSQMHTTAENSVFQNIRFQGDLLFQNQPQWKLVVMESFWQAPVDWTDNSITTCGGINMLGGYGKFAGGEVRKTFNELPQHSKLRISASFHFIDAWSGETGFMRADIGRDGRMEYLWTEKYDHSKVKNGVSVCGASYPEGKLTTSIDVIIPHTSDSISIGFGSTLDQDPEENSFGVSNLQIYII